MPRSPHHPRNRPFVVAVAACLLLSLAVFSQEKEPERLQAAYVHARAQRRHLHPEPGLPVREIKTGYCINTLCSEDAGERVSCGNGIWVSMNTSVGIANWMCWDVDPFQKRLPPENVQCDPNTWTSVMEEAFRWACERPFGHTTVVCGPIVTEPQSGPAAVFVAMCKKTGRGAGWKTIGFTFPSEGRKAAKNLYDFSESVNTLEFKTGYNFFPKLPKGVQERVEGMTTYELFCPFKEEDDLRDPGMDADGPEIDTDYLDDRRNSP